MSIIRETGQREIAVAYGGDGGESSPMLKVMREFSTSKTWWPFPRLFFLTG
jgi:hypothetical protein